MKPSLAQRSALHVVPLACLALAAIAAVAHAVTTRQFSLDSAQSFAEGKLEGAAVLSSGAVIPSVGTERVALPSVGVARSVLTRPDGSVIVGTGNQGKLFRIAGKDVALYAETGELLVTSLAAGDAGIVYAGTLPHGKIFAIEAQGKARLFAQPQGAEHIWALVYDQTKHALYAATGPQGKVFVIDTKAGTDAKGRIEPFLTTTARHVLSLAQDEAGVLYAGTSDEALLYRITNPKNQPKRIEVLYDFQGNELTALSVRNGRVAVTSNHFPKPPGPADKKPEDPNAAPRPGTGELFVVEPDGQARKWFASSDDGHLTAVQWAKDGTVYAATSKAGHLYRVNGDGTNALWVDVDEREILDLHLNDEHPTFSTGDAGAVYRVLQGRANEALFTSKVLDTGFPSRFGRIDVRAQGKLALQTRSGNTEKPGDGWSDWSAPLAGPGIIRSPGARFLQVRAKLDATADTTLYALTAYYLPGNQSATSKDVTVRPNTAKGAEDVATASYKIEWKTDNPDGDRLRYRLRVRPEAKSSYRPILRDSEVLLKPQYDWNTEGMPDGYYRVEVETSDELDNGPSAAQLQRAESEPFLIDNRPPTVASLHIANGKLVGVAQDAWGPISRLEYSVDSLDFHPLPPRDGLLDSNEEAFEVALPELASGQHPVVAVRARDARNNIGIAELWMK